MYSAACVDETSLTDIALGSVLDGTSSTMRGGAVGPSSSCVHHAEVSGSARTARDTGSGAVRRRGCLGDERRVVWARCCAFSSVVLSIAASASESEWSCSWGKVGGGGEGHEVWAGRTGMTEGVRGRSTREVHFSGGPHQGIREGWGGGLKGGLDQS